MHILFVLDTWGLIGGTERYASVVVPALVERGHRVTILCREDQHPRFAAVDVLEFPELIPEGMNKGNRGRLRALLRASAPDVIFVSAMRNRDASRVFLDVAPVVRYIHDHASFCPGLNKYCSDGETCREPTGLACLRRYWLKGGCAHFQRNEERGLFFAPIREVRRKLGEIDLLRRSERVLTNSQYMLEELLKLGFDPERTRVLHLFTESNGNSSGGPGLETLDADTRRFLERNSERPLLFTPARLELPDKGVDFLLTALGELQHPFRAIVAGTGRARDWLIAKARDEGLGDRVHFAGWQNSDAIETLYGMSSVVICPSVWDEPFGLVGLEAMAHAKPVVAFEVGGIPDWLEHEVNGLMVPRKDTHAMALAVERCLGDAGLADRMGASGQRLLKERFGRDRHLDQLEAALQSACRPRN